MRTSFLLLAAANGLVALTTSGSIPVGGECSTSADCASGADCYGVTSGTIKTCGSFQASCTTDDQCATNTCNQGLCNGYKSGYSRRATGTTPVGGECSSSDDCSDGADCYGVTSGTIKTCGSFQASCTTDDQCATNTCNQGLCNGYKSGYSRRATGTTPVGGECSSSDDCSNGADCYGVTSGTIKTCGSFQASCTSDDQCATNTCNQGLCNGYKSTLTTTSDASTLSTVTVSATPSVTATPSSVPVGGECNSSADCASGADCYGVTSYTIKTCGSFQASCTSDDQCATNTCNNGLCNGFLASSLYKTASPTAA